MRFGGHNNRRDWRILVAVGALLGGLGAPVQAQAPAAQPAPARPALPPPQTYEIKLSGMPAAAPAGGPGWTGSIIIGALLAGVASIITTLMGLEKRAQLETQLQSDRHLHEEKLREAEELHKSELARQERDANELLQATEQQFQRANQHNMLSREDQKIQAELERLRLSASTSGVELELAAIRLVRERELEAAKLIHLFFDKLTSTNETERDLALLALGDSVDADLHKILVKQSAADADAASASAAPAQPVEPTGETVKVNLRDLL
ncbi:hypothetical protein ACFOLJ_12080 [Rugamonas sp. CCM 8940]|uniref:hypothetical protein n=1 Tax=Rugamonas sp. CCM 8940 TaxID=2765359 RepID=UPI0018F33A1F|nr:hypothetical protein [Rugamonas sp. CCM 8940]MBJ7311522.1 hypothetical protein [Rugamonas sp. CCM 8940]